eukprot:m.259577 g.259577  ORF g.259577 m.259577 type:complete len:53 (+) comp22618_c0_seq1:85-243(+)
MSVCTAITGFHGITQWKGGPMPGFHAIMSQEEGATMGSAEGLAIVGRAVQPV